MSTVVVIPTRNRAQLAISAIKSILQESDVNVRVLVSDNSTSEPDHRTLRTYCDGTSDPRLIFVRPPERLSMTAHWEWAMQQALLQPGASHFIYLTDRSLFKPAALRSIIEIAQQHPDRVISYDWVTIFDHLSPIMVERQLHTGQLIEVTSSRLLSLSSRSVFPHCLPRMMNCCVPRALLETIQARFGSVFASTSPDYNFCYRCLHSVDNILYYDYAAFISYAILRSNGAGTLGIQTEAVTDFIANLELSGRYRNYAAPIPALPTMTNCVIHEYRLTQRETGSQRFPEVSITQYTIRIAEEIFGNILHKLPSSVRRHLIALRSRARGLREPSIVKEETGQVFATVEDAINYAISVTTRENVPARHMTLLRE